MESQSDTITWRIEEITHRDGRRPEDLIAELLREYEQRHSGVDPLEAFIGAFDDDVTDLSVTVRRKFGSANGESA